MDYLISQIFRPSPRKYRFIDSHSRHIDRDRGIRDQDFPPALEPDQAKRNELMIAPPRSLADRMIQIMPLAIGISMLRFTETLQDYRSVDVL